MSTRKERAASKNQAVRKKARAHVKMVGKKAAKRIASSSVKIHSKAAIRLKNHPYGGMAVKQAKSRASASRQLRSAMRQAERKK